MISVVESEQQGREKERTISVFDTFRAGNEGKRRNMEIDRKKDRDPLAVAS